MYHNNPEPDINSDIVLYSFQSYERTLLWLNEPPPPDLSRIIDYRQFLADRFHYHRSRMNIGLREYGFLTESTEPDILDLSKYNPVVPWTVLADNIRSAFNVGSIFRTVECQGWEGLMLIGMTPNPGNPKLRKTAMGTDSWVKWSESNEFRSDILPSDRPLIGLETGENSIPIHEFKFPEKGILAIGNEEYGLTANVRKACEALVKIPVYGLKNSLNVSNAFAICAHFITSRHMENR